MGFYTWILDSNLSGSVMNEIAYSSDSQRQNGFQSGTVASSVRVNTALRQSTLVTAALMESMNLGAFSYENSLPDIKSAIDGFFAGLEVTPNPDMTGQTPVALTGLKIGSGYYNISSGGGGTNVVANPALGGTETNLTSIQIGATKYKCADPSQVSSNATAITGLNGSLISLQATVGGLMPTTGNGNITKNGNNIGTYSYYKVNKVVMFKFKTYTAPASTDISVNLTNFPSTNFDATNCPFTYLDTSGYAHCGRVRIYVYNGAIAVNCSDESGMYVDTPIKNAIDTWFTVILN